MAVPDICTFIRTGLLLLVILSLTIPTLHAHAPYQKFAGQFQRSDGETVSIFNYYRDGIIGTDPVSVQFRLADGSLIASTSISTDVVIKTRKEFTEVYQYPTTTIPIANKVTHFDGFSLRDITSFQKQATSFFLHLTAHWMNYAALGALLLLIFLIFARARFLPQTFYYRTVKGIAMAVASLASVFAFLFLLFEPISAPLLIAFITLAFFALRSMGSFQGPEKWVR